MPIYEYRCRKCGEIVEKIQKFSDPPLRKHSGCGGSLTKMVSQSSFQLKGSGWYVTDYAGKGKADPDGAEKTPAGDGKESKTDSGGDSKESKPEKTEDSKKPGPKKKAGVGK